MRQPHDGEQDGVGHRVLEAEEGEDDTAMIIEKILDQSSWMKPL